MPLCLPDLGILVFRGVLDFRSTGWYTRRVGERRDSFCHLWNGSDKMRHDFVTLFGWEGGNCNNTVQVLR